MASIIPFNFTVTSDTHSHVYAHEPFGIYRYFQDTCDEINSILGSPGDFMITTGDQSDSYPSTTGGTSPDVFRDVIDGRFGADFRWVNAVGNHDISSGNGKGMQWIRDEWDGSNPSDETREARQDFAFPGPDGCSTTQYYYFHKGIMFIIMNWYWDGTTSVTADEDGYTGATSGGKIIDEQLDWLRDLFSTYPGYHKIICAHGNAFAFNEDMHSDYDGLGGSNKENRDIFWQLIEKNKVIAYLHGHTHERRIDYVDNTYWNGGTIEDNWSFGKSNVPHICAGQVEPLWPGDWKDFDTFPTFMNVTVTESDVTFDIYEALSVSAVDGSWPSTADPGWEIILTETVALLDTDNKGGVWYYTQDKFGSEWFNKVSNNKGWSVDFNLRVSDVQNSNLLVNDNDKGKGAGVYVNDGSKQEVVNFFNQEIVFANINQSAIYDTTVENDYRLIGKKNNLKLFARPSGDSNYSEIADVNFSTVATPNGNALNPNVFEDTSGNLHSVWWDDGGSIGSIFYSKFENEAWSTPEEIVSLDNGVQFPHIIVDSSETIYVAFESKQTEGSIIGLVYKNDIGWSKPYYTGRDVGYCRHPKLTFDSQSNACLVWEDNRQGHPEIYLDIFLKNAISWKGEKKLSTNTYGTRRPSIASYMDNLYISWTKTEEDDTSSIEMIKYNAISSSKSSVITVSSASGKADHSDILANVSGRIFVVWHDNSSGTYKIYAAVLTPTFEFLTSATVIVDGNDGARHPVLSEQLTTGNIYIAWQDFKDSLHEDISISDIRPSNSTIYVTSYADGVFSSVDTKMEFKDERNAYAPSLPVFFSGELPVIYESYLMDSDEYSFVGSHSLLLQVKSLYYSLNGNSTFDVNYGDDGHSGNRDFSLNKALAAREIRFGDFSDVLNAHYIFKNFKYYLDDAVEPYQIKNIDANTVDIDSLSASDAKVNNHGDTWIVGTCGMYYFIDRYNRLIKVGPESQIIGWEDVDASVDTEVATEYDELKEFKVIAFDNFNNMFIGGNNGRLRYSTNHVKGFKKLTLTNLAGKTITSIVFDKDNVMFVGTSNGLYVYDEVIAQPKTATSDYNDLREIDVATSDAYSGFDPLTGNSISSLHIDANNCLWISTTDNGIYRFYKDHLLHFTTTHGLPSNIINDIAIRNTAVRYIATSKGVSKMVGFNFERVLSSKDDVIWSNNVKSIEWKDPNVLLAGTMSRTNQIIINDDDNTYSTVFYEPASAFNVDADDFSVYYLTDEAVIIDDDILEVYINGNLVSFGYDIGSDNKAIRFRSPLTSFDVVEVIIRKDLVEVYTFSRTQGEINSVGNSTVRINSLETLNSKLYAVSSGDENEVKVNDSTSILPFDRVHLDTQAPDFVTDAAGIVIGDQIDGSVVKVTITGATDTFDGIVGSGIEGMIISNYDNFTTDGSTAQSYIPFSNSVNHDLGLSLENVITELTFTSGSGSVIHYVSDDSNELYAATSSPAVVYKYNWITEEWESLYSYDTDQYVDFITKYNNKLLVSVGHDTDVSRMYIYDIDISGGQTLRSILPITESRAYCFHVMNGKLYIGSGAGLGDISASGAGDGAVYLFDDGTLSISEPSVTLIVDGIDDNVYSMTHAEGSSNLLAATGTEGYIYEVYVEDGAAIIVYNGVEDLVSIEFLDVNSQAMIFVGGDTNGVIRKTLIGSNTYDVTFKTVPAKISSMKILQVVDPNDPLKNYSTIYAAVGNVVYYLSDGGTWTWKYTHTEVINDLTLREDTSALYVVSDSGITRIKPIVDSKVIYLKLIDRAGNETVLDPIPTGDDIDTSSWVDSIDIAILKDFINEHKILEIDDLGNTVWSLGDPASNEKYYSADKIEEERGEYVSEIFDASNDLVKWENISWEAEQLENTTVSVYVRSSTSQNDILLADWIGPFANTQSAGVDISSLVGQFLQFKAVLTSATKGITPSFYRASIQAITSESVHFFTTNFTMPTKINKGIITSQKVVPVSADIVFAINTTNSVDWTEYQPVDENRIFNINQTGHNLRVGIKFISPNRSLIEPVAYDEYGPYTSNLYVNTVDFDFINNSGVTRDYHFRISLYSDVGLNNEVFSAYSLDNPDGFSADGVAIASEGVEIATSKSSNILFSVPGSANIDCDTFYFVKVEYIYDTTFETFSEDTSFVASCTSSFIDNIDFDFTNDEFVLNYYHFRIKFYQDLERTNEYLTVFSGNDRSGWFARDVQIPEAGVLVNPGDIVNIVYRPTPTDFDTGTIYYLTIEAHDGTDYVFASNSYTFQTRDIQSTEYCGGYSDVPIVKNFGIMFELDNNEFVTLNI